MKTEFFTLEEIAALSVAMEIPDFPRRVVDLTKMSFRQGWLRDEMCLKRSSFAPGRTEVRYHVSLLPDQAYEAIMGHPKPRARMMVRLRFLFTGKL